jgi:rhomboid protease GluP
MDNIVVNENDELIIKLLHYFVTEENYSPIVLKGAQNEIWLEKLNGDYKIVRLVSNYIHNNEQLNVDSYRTEQIMKRIKQKTMSFSMNALNIYVNLGENVDISKSDSPNIDLVNIKSVEELNNYSFVIEEFPAITKKAEYKEKGIELFMKLTSDIGKKNDEDAKMAEDIFTKKDPIITKILLLINSVVFILSFVLGQDQIVNMLANFGPYVKSGEIYRLITGAFVHVEVIHFFFNMYALYIIGPQLENFFGKWRYLTIYMGSAIVGNLLSIMFNPTTLSIGASGAIFGLLGALVYFGYHYRVYLDSVIKSQIIPLIILNLFIGFMSTGIDNAAHIGGLVGGVLVSMAVGVKYKSTRLEKTNGVIMSTIFFGFLLYMVFFR